MPYAEYPLPEYPCTSDVWDKLKNEKRPILIYGMGNGADKLIKRFEKYGIEFADIFASDGFVRGHEFHGIRVKSFSEVKALYPEFVIVLSFASNKPDVISMLAEIDREYEMYLPDMPVAGEEEYFDRDFYNAHYGEIVKTYSLLCDSESKSVFSSVLNYKLTGKISYLLNVYTEKSELYSLLPTSKIKSYIDVGAYNGDTLKEAVEFFPRLSKAYAIEPDRRNFKKLSAYAEALDITVTLKNSAAWSECRSGSFSDSGNRNSSVSSTASHEHKSTEIELITVDSLAADDVDYIKYDVEGAEFEALLGSLETIERCQPALLISLYHRSRDVYFLPMFMDGKFKKYTFYIRRLSSLPAWELDLIMIPNGK